MSIDVEGSICSGQVFLWERRGRSWYGVNGRDVLAVGPSGRIRSYVGARGDFFRRRDDMEHILESISRDALVRRAVRMYPGLRILDQDPFQCLVTFIISANSSIQRIRSCLARITERFGERVEFEGEEFSLFPGAEKLAAAPVRDILRCGVGYRARFVKEAARMVNQGRIDMEELQDVGYAEALGAVRSVPGVGPKVADCVLLFSLGKLEAFPLDRWMLGILEKYGGRLALGKRSLTLKRYDELHGRVVDHFGPYAGYAQQFLFKMARDGRGMKW